MPPLLLPSLLQDLFACAALRWQPGVGDPDPLGWAVAVLYGLAAMVAAVNALARDGTPVAERLFWAAAATALALLAVNKQLDLQTLLIGLGRCAAIPLGWIDLRLAIERGVFALLGAGMLALAAAVLWALRASLGRLLGPLLGLACIAGFVIARSAAILHVPPFEALIDAHRLPVRLIEPAAIVLFLAACVGIRGRAAGRAAGRASGTARNPTRNGPPGDRP